MEMGTNQKKTKHSLINNSIRTLNTVKNSLQNLVFEISGNERPTKAEIEKEPEEMSLKETLETAQERLNELIDGFNKIESELRELLF